MPSSYFHILNFEEKNIRINILMAIQYLKHFYWTPINLPVSSVVSPHSINRSSYNYNISQSWNEFSCSPLYVFKHIYVCPEIHLLGMVWLLGTHAENGLLIYVLCERP